MNTPLITPQQLAIDLGQHAPTDQQTAIIQAPLEPALVVAGAGSGKTGTIAQRVVYLVANGLAEPGHILGLTFTRKAAGELGERINLWLSQLKRRPGNSGFATDFPVISTYNAYAAGLVREHALRLGIDPDSQVLTAGVAWQLAMEVVEGSDYPEGGQAASTMAGLVLQLAQECTDNGCATGLVAEELEAIAEDISTKPAGIGPTGRQRTASGSGLRSATQSLRNRAAVMGLVQRYIDLKRERGLIDFADQVAVAARIVQSFPEVAQAERARFHTVLLDEYQDTSAIQIELLKGLFSGHAVMAVGDPHQAIYGWRGASVTGLANFGIDFSAQSSGRVSGSALLEDPPRFSSRVSAGQSFTLPSPTPVADPVIQQAGGQDTARPFLPLSIAWRNDKAILDAANALSKPLRSGSLKPEPLTDDSPAPGLSDGGLTNGSTKSGPSSLGLHEALPALEPRDGVGPGQLTASYFENQSQQAIAIAQYLACEWRGAPGRTAAVLCRVKADFAAVIEALQQAGLPYEVIGHGGLVELPEVQDILAALQAAQDPAHPEALMRLAAGARFALGIGDLAALAALAKQVASQTVVGNRPPAADGSVLGQTQLAATNGTNNQIGSAAHHSHAKELVAEATIIDALGQLDAAPSGQFTAAGLTRLRRLADILTRIRARRHLPIPELIVEAERQLGIDIDLMAKGGSAGRMHVDQLLNVAHQFVASGGQGLAAFLGWLEVEAQQDRGLEPGQLAVNQEVIQVMTMHSAKGLEWDVVVVCGLDHGRFPAVRQDSKTGHFKDSGFLTAGAGRGGSNMLPWSLRRDKTALPVFEHAAAADVVALDSSYGLFTQQAGLHALAEERRLAYVAVTRARSHLFLTGSWWVKSRANPTGPSLFLQELAAAGLVSQEDWAPKPTDPESAPHAAPEQANWPNTHPLGERESAVMAAAGQIAPHRGQLRLTHSQAVAALAGLEGELAAEARLLLQERAGLQAGVAFELPDHVSVTAAHDLCRQPAEFAAQFRRPMPAEPSQEALLGQLFHARIEALLRSTPDDGLFELDSLQPEPGGMISQRLEQLVATFVQSEWAAPGNGLKLVDLEHALAVNLAGKTVRGRADAIFQDAVGNLVLVDWKTGGLGRTTGRPKPQHIEQLELYRAMLAQVKGIPVKQIRAAIYYAKDNHTAWLDQPGPANPLAVLLATLNQIPSAR